MLKQHIEDFLVRKISGYPAAELLVAVSGGLDSMVLLHALAALAVKYQVLKCRVVHFNHHLRGQDANDDECFVARYCRQQAMELIVGQGRNIPEQRRQQGLSLEEAAREARYLFFDRCLAEKRQSWLLTAHTASDQAETVIMNLLRGSGLRGLKGIPAQRGRILRPLLALERREIQAYATRHAVPFVEDRTNRSFAFTRNRIRHQLLPLLKEEAGARLEKRLSAMAAGLAADLAVIDELVENFVSRWVEFDAKRRELFIIRRELKSQNPGLLPHIIERCVFLAGCRKQLPERTLSTLVKLAVGENRKSLTSFRLADKLFFVVQPDRIIIGGRNFEVENQQAFFLLLPGPGRYQLPENRGLLQMEFLEKREIDANLQSGNDQEDGEIFDADSISFPLVLRSWQPGDVFFPLGMAGRRKKVKNFFIDCKVPLEQKHRIPILCHEQRIIWIAGYRLDERFAVTTKTRNVMKVIYHAEPYS